jgi:beta-N-acetylhexosaminidase
MRRLLYLGLALSLVSCGPPAAAVGPSAPGQPTAHPTAAATASPGTLRLGEQEALLGPGGMTLRQEIGAVMMVGFIGPLTPAVLEDWRQHQFGGLIVVPINQNAADPTTIRQLIQSVRGVMAHPVVTAAKQEGGTVCFQESRVPCLAGARQVGSRGPAAVQSEMTSMSQGLKALGFDINFAPVADVWDGAHPLMKERSYGQNPQAVAQDVTAAIAGIHAAGLYAVAKHESAQPLQTEDWIPFQAAIAARVDFVSVPTADLRMLRTELGYPGVIISDDLQIGALTPEVPPPTAAVRFLANGGDMVIVSHDIAAADATYDAIHAAVLNGTYPRAQLDASVQKLLSLGLRFMP